MTENTVKSDSRKRPLGRTGALVTAVGFGTYRVGLDNPDHKAALELALGRGCNLIDTSTNYMDGESESCIGQVLQAAFTKGSLKRQEIVVVSKVGYVQGQNLELATEKEKAGTPFPEMVKYMAGCWHCLHPDFIRDQIGRSLERLGLEQLDVMLLHNPEYFFSDAKQRGDKTPLETLRQTFYGRIQRAFEALEDEVGKGRIKAYGVSSNTFGNPLKNAEATSVSKMWEIAQGISPNHHFSVIQLPLNLFESGPVLEKNNGEGNQETALEAAKRFNLGVLVNRPLNASVGNQLVRLATYAVDSQAKIGPSLKTIQALETKFVAELAPQIETKPGSVPAKDFFNLGKELANPQLLKITYDHWRQIETEMILPQILYLLKQLDDHFAIKGKAEWQSWSGEYRPALDNVLKAVRSETAKNSRKLSDGVDSKLNALLPPAMKSEGLERKAIAVVANTPGVSSVLSGMRSKDYVESSMGVLALPAFTVTEKVYSAFKLK